MGRAQAQAGWRCTSWILFMKLGSERKPAVRTSAAILAKMSLGVVSSCAVSSSLSPPPRGPKQGLPA